MLICGEGGFHTRSLQEVNTQCIQKERDIFISDLSTQVMQCEQ